MTTESSDPLSPDEEEAQMRADFAATGLLDISKDIGILDEETKLRIWNRIKADIELPPTPPTRTEKVTGFLQQIFHRD